MKQLILLRGYPGAGKTTIGKLMEKHGHGVFIDHNAILTFIAGFTGDDDGIYDEISNLEQAMTSKLLRDGKKVVVARGFSSARSVEPYVKMAAEQGAKVHMIRLVVADEVLAARVQSPERKQDYNPTTSPEVLRAWMQDNPLEDIAEEKLVDANRPAGDVLAAIRDLLGQ